jgi:hypothetical protein
MLCWPSHAGLLACVPDSCGGVQGLVVRCAHLGDAACVALLSKARGLLVMQLEHVAGLKRLQLAQPSLRWLRVVGTNMLRSIHLQVNASHVFVD